MAVEIPLKNASAQAIKKKTGKAVFHNTVVSNTSAHSNKPTKITPVNTMPTAAAQKPFRKIKIKILAGKRDTQWRKPKFTNKGGSNTDKALMGNICQSPQSHKYGKNSKTPMQNAAEVPSIKAVRFKASNDSSCRPVVHFPERHSNSKPAATSRQPTKMRNDAEIPTPMPALRTKQKSPATQAMPPSRHQRETIRFEKSSSHPQNVQTAYYTRLKPQL